MNGSIAKTIFTKNLTNSTKYFKYWISLEIFGDRHLKCFDGVPFVAKGLFVVTQGTEIDYRQTDDSCIRTEYRQGLECALIH